jgi:hypothetical protein
LEKKEGRERETKRKKRKKRKKHKLDENCTLRPVPSVKFQMIHVSTVPNKSLFSALSALASGILFKTHSKVGADIVVFIPITLA